MRRELKEFERSIFDPEGSMGAVEYVKAREEEAKVEKRKLKLRRKTKKSKQLGRIIKECEKF